MTIPKWDRAEFNYTTQVFVNTLVKMVESKNVLYIKFKDSASRNVDKE